MVVSPIKELSMDDLVELFKKQVNLYGVDKFLPLLVESSVVKNSKTPAGVKSADQPASGDEQSDADDESVDLFSDSDISDGVRDDDICSHGSDVESDNFSGDDASSDGSLENGVGVRQDLNMIHLHDPPIFDSIHCPPFDSIEKTMHGVCDCCDFGMETCCKEDEFQFFSAVEFYTEFDACLESINLCDRIAQNLLRKRLYKMLFHATDFGILEKNERRKLPNCAVAKIRQIYPSLTGDYMGFKES